MAKLIILPILIAEKRALITRSCYLLHYPTPSSNPLEIEYLKRDKTLVAGFLIVLINNLRTTFCLLACLID